MNVTCSPFGVILKISGQTVLEHFTHMHAFTITHTDTFECTNITNILFKQPCKHAL